MFGVKAATFALSALAAASLAYWGLKVFGTPAPGAVAPVASVVGMAAIDPQAVVRALGGGEVAVPVAAVAPSASSRFSLKGVVADTSNGGAALISVDGKPARPFQVGDLVDGRLVVQSVTGRKASLAAGTQAPVEVVLELPPLPQ
jgi:general secretion pathway protein C